MAALTAMDLTFTTMSRLGVEGVLGEQKPGKRETGPSKVYYRIRKKMGVTKDLRDQVSQQFGDKIMISPEKCDEIPPITIHLEAAEVEEFYKFFNTNPDIPVVMMDWSEPIVEQIEEQRLLAAAAEKEGKKVNSNSISNSAGLAAVQN